MLFDDAFINDLKEDPISGVIAVCNRVKKQLNEEQQGWFDSDYEALAEGFALIDSAIEAGLITYDRDRPEITGVMTNDCIGLFMYIRDIEMYFSSQATKLKFNRLKSTFKLSLGSGFSYEFSQGDLSKIQSLINELREQIAASNHFEHEHQQRLLRRLEKIQSELHKKVSDLDRFWGLIGDAGVVLGKFGKDAKPLVDRIKEIAEIVWQTQSRAEELPSGTPIPLLARSTDAAKNTEA
jgi:hypothetical protein